jgi:pilus assembly protein CpaF
LLDELDPGEDMQGPGFRERVEEMFNTMLAHENLVLNRGERQHILTCVLNEVLALGPLTPLMEDETIRWILVTGPERVFVDRGSGLEMTDVQFRDDDQVRRILDRLLAPLGQRLDERWPTYEARLPDGAHLTAFLDRISPEGTVLSIRKRRVQVPLTPANLVDQGVLTQEQMDLLQAYVADGKNILITGARQSGKTTLLNSLISTLPDNDFMITVETQEELQPRQVRTIRLVRPILDRIAYEEVPLVVLIKRALVLRPDHLIIGDLSGEEVVPLLHAMSQGQVVMACLCSDSDDEALSLLGNLYLQATNTAAPAAIRERLACIIHVTVHIAQTAKGCRVEHIREVTSESIRDSL